jgi:hypothetical protein
MLESMPGSDKALDRRVTSIRYGPAKGVVLSERVELFAEANP